MSRIIADAFLFDGQGTAACTSSQTENIALRDSELPLGSALLQACFQAFTQEFASLSTDERSRSGIEIDAFKVAMQGALSVNTELRYLTLLSIMLR